MNKKEQAQMEELRTKLALRFYPEVLPDLDIPTYEEGIINGYIFNEYTNEIIKACTSEHHHSIRNWDKTTSQNPIKLYSTRELAYKGLLHEMAKSFAKELRKIEILAENTEVEDSPL